MKEFFTDQEIQDVKAAMKSISNVGIVVDSKSADDEQMDTFFDKAKLWHVIKEIISVLYIERLADKKMFLHDKKGDEYWVIPKTKPREAKQ